MKRNHDAPFRGHITTPGSILGQSQLLSTPNLLLAVLPSLSPRVPREAPYAQLKVVFLASRPEPNRKWPRLPTKKRPAIRAAAALADDLTACIDPAKLERHLSNPTDPGRFHQPHGQHNSILAINAPVEVEEVMVGGMEGKVRGAGDAGRPHTPNREERQYRKQEASQVG